MDPQGDQGYTTRIVDAELDEVFGELAAISLDGVRGIGKTATAAQRARTIHELDRPEVLEIIESGPDRLVEGDRPILIDEWQRYPPSWDFVRRAVDRDSRGGQFLLTGSAAPATPPSHSGAGRIVRVRMRPFTLFERGVAAPTVSVAALLGGDQPEVHGATEVTIDDYVEEILASGFPAVRSLGGRARRAQLDGYLDRIVDTDFAQSGAAARAPRKLHRWLAAYAAATSTTSSYETIRDAATGGEGDKPARSTTQPYRDVLETMWVLDPLPAWLPSSNHLGQLGAAPKHHLADPALAAALLKVNAEALLDGTAGTPSVPRDGTLLGALFESLVTLDVRVYAQACDGRTSHLRTHRGEREVDLIVEGRDGRVLAIEVKLKQVPNDHDVRHLHWLRRELGRDLLDAVVVTTGSKAYRRPDGVAVVPAALLGP